MAFSEASEAGKGRIKDMKMIAAVVVLCGLTAITAKADPLSTYDDVVVSADVMDECHIVISGLASDDKMRAIGDAAWHQLWVTLDEQDSAHHEENGQTAEDMLKHRTEAAMAKGHDLVISKGCPALVGHAREVLETYRQ